MLMRILVTLTAIGGLATAGSLATADGSRTATATADAPWQQEIEQLRASDAVLPRVAARPVYNANAPIPPQCYTRTEGTHNPCYVCHQDAIAGRENVMNDGKLQAKYDFTKSGAVNRWLNLFEDRRQRVARISDAEILAWIDADNYSELPARLRAAEFKGWVPDLAGLERGAAAFDTEGLARDGSYWMAINYKPFPSTFWPTNGSSDDVMVRLPDVFRRDAGGVESRDVYLANLALLEIGIKGLAEVDTFPLDESRVSVDLDGDGALGRTTRVRARDHYVGRASPMAIEPTVYPQATEFMHTVRYLAPQADGSVGGSRRMKEVRYMRRVAASTREGLRLGYQVEENETEEAEEGEEGEYRFLGDKGLVTKMGWQLSGFIEGGNGRLRVSTKEEQMFCVGCHNTIGSTIDKTFSFARKRDGVRGWGYIDLHGMPDAPNRGETRGEYATYLERAGGGSEFRSNPEMQARWFHKDGTLNREAVAGAADVYELITPSRKRALLLNKAYRVIVTDQSFLFGRDPTVSPATNVYDSVDVASAPTLPASQQFQWDLRLHWN